MMADNCVGVRKGTGFVLIPTPCCLLDDRRLLQNSEDYGYEVIGPDTPSHVPTDPCFEADEPDIVLCNVLSFLIHVEVLYDVDISISRF
ncbi:hypothetical protein EVAR_11885_1 [Eumeta japonica]|uniref:Uncharacterized protein n=1 Tax=Eumeta variegata TaxID=151549 RepID=A0A4C1U7R4_EUMVA|nr:hypothetical protein EVAR_11885_1 [Eumeta japonica]